MTDLTQFQSGHHLSLETFRKNGRSVRTPVWFVQEGENLYIWTGNTTGKVKRIRNNAQVNIAPCERFGKITGQWVGARATLDDSTTAVAHVTDIMRQKLGLEFVPFSIIENMMDRLKGHHRISIKLSFEDS